jgi:curved DNA-binding protein CbpA
MEDNFYAILEIEITASEDEMKRAYFRKIKKYPVEQFPIEFEQIRKAYQVLKDPKAREEYHSMRVYGDQIESLRKAGLAALDEDDYEGALEYFKKILVIEPGITDIRNYYALSLLYLGESEKAIHQFKRLITIEPENILFQLNYAKALEDLDLEVEALQQYKKMYLLHSDNLDVIFGLIDFYVKRKEIPRALILLDKALRSQKQEGFYLFYLLLKRLRITVILRDRSEIKQTLNRIEDFIKGYPEELGRISTELFDIGFDLYKEKLYSLAEIIFKFIAPMKSDHPKFESLLAETEENAVVYDEFDRLKEDNKVLQSIKSLLLMYLFGDEFSEEEFKEFSEKAYDNVFYSARYNPSETVLAINRVLVKYPHLYECRKDVLSSYIELSKTSIKREKEFDRLKEDSKICFAVIRLVAYYLSYFDSDEEKKEAFDDVWDDISSEADDVLSRSSIRLETIYPELFELNEKFFKDLQS